MLTRRLHLHAPTRRFLNAFAPPVSDRLFSPQKAIEALTDYKNNDNGDQKVLAAKYLDAIVSCRVNKSPVSAVEVLKLTKTEVLKTSEGLFGSSSSSLGLKVGEMSLIFEHGIHALAESQESDLIGAGVLSLVDDSPADDCAPISLKTLGLQTMQLMGEKDVPHSMVSYMYYLYRRVSVFFLVFVYLLPSN